MSAAVLVVVAASAYAEVGAGAAIGNFGSYRDGGTSWGIPLSLGGGLQGSHWRVGIEARYQRRLFLDPELRSAPGSNYVQALLTGSVGSGGEVIDHRFHFAVGPAYDSKQFGSGFASDVAYGLTHTPSGLFLRTGISAGAVQGDRNLCGSIQLSTVVGWRLVL
ncbi:MAG: hypothetical protein JNL79_35095 [Myxococcales bacterium]|nr:hypothetical protein [Myxococcales bacterium]